MFQFLDGFKPIMQAWGTSIEALSPESCNAGSRRTWIDTKYCGKAISIKKTIKITSLNTNALG